MLSFQEALQEALWTAYNDHSGKFEFWVVASNGEAVTPSYSAQSLAKSFSDEELENMDWWLLAGEILESLYIEENENERYSVTKAAK